MQFTVQPGDPVPSPAEFLGVYLLKIHRAQSDALDILQRVMIQAARLLEDPPLEKPYQTRATNERMRIAMRSAATIINMRIPKLPSELSPPPAPSPSRSQREGRPRPGEVGEGSSFCFATTTAAPTTPASALQAAAGATLHPLSTHGSALKTLPVLPRDSSLVAHRIPSPRPADLTFDERATIYMIQQGVSVPRPPTIAAKLRAWHLYTEATGIKPPFNITPESLLAPRPTRKRRRAPTRDPPPLLTTPSSRV